MNGLDKYWKILIVLGIVFLAAAIGWEIYQIRSGNRDDFTLTVNEMPRQNLLSPEIINHLRSQQ